MAESNLSEILSVSSIVNVAVLITAGAVLLSTGANTDGIFCMGTSTNETSVSDGGEAGNCLPDVISV